MGNASTGAADDAADDAEPLVSCSAQGGTISVYGDRIVFDRSGSSMFDDKTVPLDEVRGVEYSGGFVTGHLQVDQVGFDNDSAGFLGHPVDENTLHFPRSERPCMTRARDAILERASGE